MNLLIIVIIAVSLSMDAFSLSLAYGTLGLEKRKIYELSIIVGLYHFFMPLLGVFVGDLILKIIPIEANTLVFLVLSFIGLEMIYESFSKQEHMNIGSFVQLLIFGLAVSLDSLSVGMGLSSLHTNYLICSLIFALTSLIFTYVGLVLGKKISDAIGKCSTIFGGITLILISLTYLT